MTISEAVSTPIKTILAEKRVTFYNLSWQSYKQVLSVLGNKRAAQLTYYKGTLEIVSPLEEHESVSDCIGILIYILTRRT